MQAVHRALNRIREIEALRALRDRTDQELLDRFARGEDDHAFVALVERHAAMILGVCWRALGCPHDAEDACQAVFLVLARSAATVRSGASLGAWLHGVALRVVGRMRRDRARQSERDARHVRPPPADPPTELARRETLAALDEELNRLPERYRAALILCYLEGHSRAEAAAWLRTSPGALHGLLERGRKLLADRLSHRGVTLSAGVLAGLAATGTTRAAVPTALFAITTQATVGVLAPAVQSLTQQILKEMAMTKFKLATLGVLCGVLVLAAGFGFAQDVQPKVAADYAGEYRVFLNTMAEDTDEAFIRRVSLDLRGKVPTPAEVHFFVANKDAKKRDRLVDLFVQERGPRADDKAQLYLYYERLLGERTKEAPATGAVEAIKAEIARKQKELDAVLERVEADKAREAATQALLRDKLKSLSQQLDAQFQLDKKSETIPYRVPLNEKTDTRPVLKSVYDRLATKEAPTPSRIEEAIGKSDLAASFKPVGGPVDRATQPGVVALTQKLEATRRVNLATFNKKYQVVFFDETGTLLAAGDVDFGSDVTLEKGEAVGLTFPAVDANKVRKIVIRPVRAR